MRALVYFAVPAIFLSSQAHASPPAERAPASALLRDPAALSAWLRERSPEVAGSAAREAEARAEAGSARLFPNPTAEASLGNISSSARAPRDVKPADRLSWGAGLSWEVELGKRGPRIRAADLEALSARASFEESLAERVAEARAALAEAVRLRARQTILEDSLEASRQNVELQKVRLDHGDLSGSEYDRLLVDSIHQASDADRGRAELEAALATCAGILVAPCELDDDGADALDAAAALPSELPDAEGAVRSRPDYRSIDLSRRAAEQEGALARRRAIPDPTFSVGFEHDPFNEVADWIQAGVGIPLPLFDRGQHDVARAVARQRALDRDATALVVQELARIRALEERRRSLEESLRRLEGEAVPLSAGIVASTLAAFNHGEIGMTDWLLVRRENTELLLQVLDLRGELFAVRNDLRRAYGLDAAVSSPDG